MKVRGNDRQAGISPATCDLIWRSHLGADTLSNAAVKQSEQVCFHLTALKQTFLALDSLLGQLKLALITSTDESTSRGAESPQSLLI